MGKLRKYSITFGGPNGLPARGRNANMKVEYAIMFDKADIDIEKPDIIGFKKPTYQQIFIDNRDYFSLYLPTVLLYQNVESIGIKSNQGINIPPEGLGSGQSYSFYRREYEVYVNPKTSTSTILPDAKIFKGPWEPVAINYGSGQFRDFNVTANRSYQYIMYPYSDLDNIVESEANRQTFANWDQDIFDESTHTITIGKWKTSYKNGAPVDTHCGWNEWSIAELIPVENEKDIPIVKSTFKVNLDQIWLFKFSLETGTQTQNINRSEQQMLGRYPRIGCGTNDSMSGEVSCLLGDEIIPLSINGGYIERLRKSKNIPLSTNERTKMLQQWRALVSSKNPKLLTDIKGQSWIVQIMGSSNTPKNFYYNQPDTISFQWKEIMSTDKAIIYSEVGTTSDERPLCNSDEWQPLFRTWGKTLKK